jgi:hypothetical protein
LFRNRGKRLKGKGNQSISGNNPVNSTTIFFYISIPILSVLVLFLSYRLLENLGVFNDSNEASEPDQKKKTIQVEILNGCGVPGIADKFTDELRKKNFDVVHTGNYRSFNIDETIVISRTGNRESAEFLAKAIGIDETAVVTQINKEYFLHATLIMGKNYKQLFKNK